MSAFHSSFCRTYEKTRNYKQWKDSLTMDEKADALLRIDQMLHRGSFPHQGGESVLDHVGRHGHEVEPHLIHLPEVQEGQDGSQCRQERIRKLPQRNCKS